MTQYNLTEPFPIAITTSWFVGANQERTALNLRELNNPYAKSMLVEEIRISSTDSAYGAIFAASLKLRLGLRDVTNGFIPMDVIAPFDSGAGQVLLRLARPLYIRPTDLLEPTVWSPTNLTVDFTLLGRLTDELPAGSPYWMPYISAWSTDLVAPGTTSLQRSPRPLFANPFRVPLQVRRFVGSRTVDPASQLPAYASKQAPINLRVQDSKGRPIIRDLIPFYDVFQPRDRTWAVETDLYPGAFYSFSTQATGVGVPTGARISMFGYRQEVL